jgi:hypothetical protein
MTGVARKSFSVSNNHCYDGARAPRIPNLCMQFYVLSTVIQTVGTSSVFYIAHYRKRNTVHTRRLYVRVSLYTIGDTLQRLCDSSGGWSQQASHYGGPGSITGHSCGICGGINRKGEVFSEYFRFP